MPDRGHPGRARSAPAASRAGVRAVSACRRPGRAAGSAPDWRRGLHRRGVRAAAVLRYAARLASAGDRRRAAPRRAPLRRRKIRVFTTHYPRLAFSSRIPLWIKEERHMIRAIDHLVILVEDLDAASADYTALGFTVTLGGTHADGATHNALVVFADDSYLELIAFRHEAPEHHWWRHVAAGEGLIDFALLPTAIAEDAAAAQSRGLEMYGPYAGGRLRPDGLRVAWQN